MRFPITDPTETSHTTHESGLPARIADAFPAFVATLTERQEEIFAARLAADPETASYAACGLIYTTAGGPSGMDASETESLQDAIESIGVACYIGVEKLERNFGPAVGCWYEITVQWSADGQTFEQRFFLDGTPISPAAPVVEGGI